MNVISLFAGCGGLDLGFEIAGFNVIWANEFDSAIETTYRKNHPKTEFSNIDIRTLSSSQIPDADGIIGGPPCQAWSEGGKSLGLKDERGRLFLDYIRIVTEKRPKFFVIENVPGILSAQHITTFKSFLKQLESSGYKVQFKLLDAVDFGVAQNRKRIIIVGIRNDINIKFSFPTPTSETHVTLRQAIGDLEQYEPQINNTLKSADGGSKCPIANHDVFNGTYDIKYMSRNRVRSWDEPSFTIQAQAKNEPLHPSAPKMIYVSKDQRVFAPNASYRRLSVRECARIQSFPDDFEFFYNNVRDGYKMVGNAVPPLLSKAIAQQIIKAFTEKSDTSEKILAVTVFPSKYNDTFERFTQNSHDIEYYFGRFHSTRKDFIEMVKNVHNFAPIIDGKITAIYKIISFDICHRSELPHSPSIFISPNDNRIVISLTLIRQLHKPHIINNLPRGWSYQLIPLI